MSEEINRFVQHVEASPPMRQEELAQRIVDTAAQELYDRSIMLGSRALDLEAELSATTKSLRLINGILNPSQSFAKFDDNVDYSKTDIYTLVNAPGNVDPRVSEAIYDSSPPFDLVFAVAISPQTGRRNLTLEPWIDESKELVEDQFGPGFLARNIAAASRSITNVLQIMDSGGNINAKDRLIVQGAIANAVVEDDRCSFTVTDPALFYAHLSKHKIVGPKSWVALLCLAGLQAEEH